MTSSLQRTPPRQGAHRALTALLVVAVLWTPGRVQAAGMDVNDDGLFNIFDALSVIYCVLDLGVCTNMDFNQDTNTNVLDALMLLNCIVGLGPCLTLTPGACLTADDCLVGEMCNVPTKKCITPVLLGGLVVTGHSVSSDATTGYTLDGTLSAGAPAGSAQSPGYKLTGILTQ